jgi:serine O-acetyltransferase
MRLSHLDDRKHVPFWSSIAADIRAHVSPSARPSNRAGWFPIALKVILGSSGFHAVLNYRIAHTARARWGALGKPASRACFWFGRHWYGCAIASTACLHGGLILPHPQGIVIGGDAVVGPESWIFQNVTIGGTSNSPGTPKIGAGARIYTGAVIVGPVSIGDCVQVGANAVVTRDVPDGSRVLAPRADPLAAS